MGSEVQGSTVQGAGLEARCPGLEASGSGFTAQGSACDLRLGAWCSRRWPRGPWPTPRGSRRKARGAVLEVQGSRPQAPGPRLEAQGSMLDVRGSRLGAPDPRLHAAAEARGARLEARGQRKARCSDSEQGLRLEAWGSRLDVRGSRLEVRGPRFNAQGSMLEAGGSKRRRRRGSSSSPAMRQFRDRKELVPRWRGTGTSGIRYVVPECIDLLLISSPGVLQLVCISSRCNKAGLEAAVGGIQRAVVLHVLGAKRYLNPIQTSTSPTFAHIVITQSYWTLADMLLGLWTCRII